MMQIGPTLCSAAARMYSGLVNWVARGQQSCLYPQLKAENHIVKRNRMSAVMRFLLGLSMGGMLFATELSARTVEEANAAIRDGNQELGLSILHELAYAGDLDAMYYLGREAFWRIAIRDIPERTSCREMIDFTSRAANRSHPPSMRELGFMYDPKAFYCSTELSPLRNLRTAVAWIQRAALAGDIEAQIDLGKRYEEGNGVLQDDAQAEHWFSVAARRPVSEQRHLNGTIIQRGSPKAQTYLADLYWLRGDYVRAHAWFNISATNGYVFENTRSRFDSADMQRDHLRSRMTQQQIDRAQALARRCLGSQYRYCD